MFQHLVIFYSSSFMFYKGWTEEDSQWMTQINRLQKLIDRLEKKVCISVLLVVRSLSVKIYDAILKPQMLVNVPVIIFPINNA